MTSTDSNIATLLDHQDWVRALARSLVADPSRADDVAQQTMLEAMTRPPRALSSPKGWLARVAKNAARALARQEGRRRRREDAVAADAARDRSRDRSDDPATAAQRAAAHKRLVDELFELEEPYHTVVLLRYFDDLQVREIADRLGRPLNTVRTQLQRGLERMRTRLDDEFGGREVWCAALLPLFSARTAKAVAAGAGSGVPILTALGALAMWKWILPVVGAVLALVLGFELIGVDWRTPAPEEVAQRPAIASADVAKVEGTAPVQRDPVPAAAAPAGVPIEDGDAEDGVVEERLRGRVVTVDGRALPGVELVYHDPKLPRLRGNELAWDNMSITLEDDMLAELRRIEPARKHFVRQFGHEAEVVEQLLLGTLQRPRATTDGNGQFEIVGTDEADGLRVEGTDWIPYGVGALPDDDRATMILGPGVAVAGRIVDEHGAPIEGVYVHLGYNVATLPGIAQRFDGASGRRSWNAHTDSEGSFDLGVVPAHPQLEVTAQERGYRALLVGTTKIAGPVVWTLRAVPASERRILSGAVYFADGRPAPKASVRFGGSGASTDAAGRFEIDLGNSSFSGPLTAHVSGQQPAILEGVGARLREDLASGRDLTLTLGGEPLSITGRALGPDGEPMAGASIFLGDGTVWGSSAGSLEAWMDRRGNGVGKDGWVTDEAGRFELGSLSARDYTLRVVDEDSLLVVESEPIAAGSTDVVLRAPADAFLPELSGVLVDRFDNPVVGARVAVTAVTKRGLSLTTFITRPKTAESDGSGRFTLADCPQYGVKLWITGDGLEGTSPKVEGSAMRIVVTRQVRFRLTGTPTSGIEEFRVVDQRGERVSITAEKPGVTTSMWVHDVPRGGSPVYTVPDTASELLFLDADEGVVRRMVLSLAAEGIQEIAL